MTTSRSLLLLEAVERARLVTVRDVAVHLDLRHDDGFESVTRIHFSCSEPGGSTFVDFHGTSLTRVELNGHPVEARWSEGRIALDDLAAENELVVAGEMAYSSDGEGLHRHVDAADGNTYLYAMSFLDAAPRWFACFDQPDLKARYSFEVLAPEGWLVRGNSRAEQLAPGVWRLGPSNPLSTYLVTLVAGPWAQVTDVWAPGDGDEMALALLARQSLADELNRDASDILAVTRACLAEYERLFGMRYPFGDYLQVFAPDFNAGAMENPGCVIFRDQFLARGETTEAQRASRAGVIAHEMAHQWFGDLVTMRWWDDLWLNESFAEYMGHRVCTDVAGYELWTEFGTRRKAWGFAADQAPSTHPVAGNGAADARAALANFDGISYAKGASVLRQLAAWMGEGRFLAGLRDYFAAHAWGNATMADLMDAWRAQGVEGLDEWASRWLTTAGLDLVSASVDGDQACLLRGGTRPHALEVAVVGAKGSHEQVGVVLDGERVVVPLAVRPGDVVLPDSDDSGWARIRPAVVGDQRWWRFPGRVLPTTAQRVAFGEAMRDAVRSGDLDPAEALDQVLANLPGESHPLLVQTRLAWARELCGAWSAPDARAQRRRRVADVAVAMMDDAEPGSDLELVALRCLLLVGDDLERLQAWRRGECLPRPLGPEEQWDVVRRLVVLGGDPVVIDDQLAIDRSSSAEVQAAECRACIPTDEAKREALAVVLEAGQPSAYLAAATARGIFRNEQHALTRALVRPWFEGIAATARFRQGWALASVVRAGFPMSHADRPAVEACRRALAAHDVDPGVRRELVDALDELERAARAVESSITGVRT